MPDAGGTASAFCTLDTFHRDDAWALIDYANGRAERPRTTNGIDLDPVVDRLRAWSGEVGRYESGRFGQNRLRWPTPRLTTVPATSECVRMPDQMKYDDLLALTVAIDTGIKDGVVPPGMACRTILVAFDDDGSILNVAVPESYEYDKPYMPADVVGNTVEDATQRLRAQGLVVETIGRVDCRPVGVVSAEEPFRVDGPAALDGSTVVLAYTSESGPCLGDLSIAAATD